MEHNKEEVKEVDTRKFIRPELSKVMDGSATATTLDDIEFNHDNHSQRELRQAQAREAGKLNVGYIPDNTIEEIPLHQKIMNWFNKYNMQLSYGFALILCLVIGILGTITLAPNLIDSEPEIIEVPVEVLVESNTTVTPDRLHPSYLQLYLEAVNFRYAADGNEERFLASYRGWDATIPLCAVAVQSNQDDGWLAFSAVRELYGKSITCE